MGPLESERRNISANTVQVYQSRSAPWQPARENDGTIAAVRVGSLFHLEWGKGRPFRVRDHYRATRNGACNCKAMLPTHQYQLASKYSTQNQTESLMYVVVPASTVA